MPVGVASGPIPSTPDRSPVERQQHLRHRERFPRVAKEIDPPSLSSVPARAANTLGDTAGTRRTVKEVRIEVPPVKGKQLHQNIGTRASEDVNITLSAKLPTEAEPSVAVPDEASSDRRTGEKRGSRTRTKSQAKVANQREASTTVAKSGMKSTAPASTVPQPILSPALADANLASEPTPDKQSSSKVEHALRTLASTTGKAKPFVSHLYSAANTVTPPNHVLQPHRPRGLAFTAITRHLGVSKTASRSQEVEAPENDVALTGPGDGDAQPAVNLSQSLSSSVIAAHKASIALQEPKISKYTSISTSANRSIKGSRLPDLLSIRPNLITPVFTNSLVGHTATKPFSLCPPPYTDADVPLPEAYNAEYPHPLTAYASPGVNPATVRASGHGEALIYLLRTNPDKVQGSILASLNHEDVIVPSLARHTSEGDGNGIPERLSAHLESLGAARLPVGVAGVSPFGDAPSGPILPQPMAPRFAVSHSKPYDQPDEHCTAVPQRMTTTRRNRPPSIDNPSHWQHRAVVHDSGDNQLRHSLSSNDLSRNEASLQISMARSLSNDSARGYVVSTNRSHSLSPFDLERSSAYKIEICENWKEQGVCIKGVQCRFAHGINELRRPISFSIQNRIRPGQQYLVQSGLFDESSVTPRNPTFSVHPVAPVRADCRRASAPPPSLCTVVELDDSAPGLSSHARADGPMSMEFFGSKRHSPRTPSIGGALDPSGWSSRAETVPAFFQSSNPSSRESTITPRASISSFSTSSSSRYSSFSSSTDNKSRTSHKYSPIEVEVGQPHAVQRPRTGDSPPTYPTASASFDFSAGNSIWC